MNEVRNAVATCVRVAARIAASQVVRQVWRYFVFRARTSFMARLEFHILDASSLHAPDRPLRVYAIYRVHRFLYFGRARLWAAF